MDPVIVMEGAGPVILAQPHGGTYLPEALAARLNERGRGLADTDWHIDHLYAELLPRATVVRATFSRYAVDANRDPSGASLYPGQNTTGLCPTIDFDGEPIYREGEEPGPEEIEERRLACHAPYHDALAEEIERVKGLHGFCLLFDCHSIRSEVPFLFEGRLPVFNLGSNGGASLDPALEAEAVALCREAESEGYDWVLNGRFKGGWTTRHYGRPAEGVQALQLELAQRAYMEEAAPWRWRGDRADRVRPYLQRLLERLEASLIRLAA